MKDQFVDYQTALRLKKLGFEEECIAFYLFDKQLQLSCAVYNNNSYWKDSKFKELSAPLWQQVTKWLREVHHFNMYITPSTHNDIEGWKYCLPGTGIWTPQANKKNYPTYELALSEGLTEALKLI